MPENAVKTRSVMVREIARRTISGAAGKLSPVSSCTGRFRKEAICVIRSHDRRDGGAPAIRLLICRKHGKLHESASTNHAGACRTALTMFSRGAVRKDAAGMCGRISHRPSGPKEKACRRMPQRHAGRHSHTAIRRSGTGNSDEGQRLSRRFFRSLESLMVGSVAGFCSSVPL